MRLAVDVLRLFVRYDPESGELYWLPRTPESLRAAGRRLCSDRQCQAWNERFAGGLAFAERDPMGYPCGSLFGHRFKAHQVCWALATGAWQTEQIDHIDGQRSNNRFANLREVTIAENCRNLAMPSHNKSGVVGVSWSRERAKWFAAIQVGGQSKALGRFDRFDDAVTARRAAEIEHNFHPNHGRRA